MSRILNHRVITALVSAVSAVVCAVITGCRLMVGEVTIKDTSTEILPHLLENDSASTEVK